MADVDALYEFGAALPRTDAVVVHGRRKLRVKSLVYAALSTDETLMGFAYPRLERDALIASAPGVFSLPRASDMRFNWVLAQVAKLADDEAQEFVFDAWAMVVPRFLERETRLRMGFGAVS